MSARSLARVGSASLVLSLVLASSANSQFCQKWMVTNYQLPSARLAPEVPSDVCIADLDGDGCAEVVVINDSCSLIRIHNGATGEVEYTSPAIPTVEQIVLRDSDGDGLLDVVVSISNYVYVFGWCGPPADVSGNGSGSSDFGSLTVGPNPTTSGTVLHYSLAESGVVDLCVYDAEGREVRGLIRDSSTPQGGHTAIWDGLDDNGHQLACGVYFCELRVDNQVVSQVRSVLLR